MRYVNTHAATHRSQLRNQNKTAAIVTITNTKCHVPYCSQMIKVTCLLDLMHSNGKLKS